MDSNNKIPSIFHSHINEKPIENCIMCERFLLDENTQYMIEKAFKDGQVEFEYAICIDCIENMKGTMSEESLMNIENYLIEHMNNKPNEIATQFHEGIDGDTFLNNCAIKGTPRAELKEYNIGGLFRGKSLDPMAFPYLISFEAAEEINSVLSKQTKDELDDFYDDMVGLPPEWMEIIKTNRPILI